MTGPQIFYLFILPVLIAAGGYGAVRWQEHLNKRADTKHSRR